MKLTYILCLLSTSSVLAFPITQLDSLATVGSSSDSTSTDDPNSVLGDVKTDAITKAAAAPKVNAASVKTAVSNFAKDANTVSSSLNSLGSTTDKTMIKSLASTAFKAESDEDAQRSVLAAAAGSAGKTSNAKIVKNTPTVLNGLSAIMDNPATVKDNLATIQNARNPEILPSITQLSNAALDAMGLPQTAQKFPATTG